MAAMLVETQARAEPAGRIFQLLPKLGSIEMAVMPFLEAGRQGVEIIRTQH